MVGSGNVDLRAPNKIGNILISHLVTVVTLASANRNIIIFTIHLRNSGSSLRACKDNTGRCVLHEHPFIFDLIVDGLFQCDLSTLHSLVRISIGLVDSFDVFIAWRCCSWKHRQYRLG